MECTILFVKIEKAISCNYSSFHYLSIVCHKFICKFNYNKLCEIVHLVWGERADGDIGQRSFEIAKQQTETQGHRCQDHAKMKRAASFQPSEDSQLYSSGARIKHCAVILPRPCLFPVLNWIGPVSKLCMH